MQHDACVDHEDKKVTTVLYWCHAKKKSMIKWIQWMVIHLSRISIVKGCSPLGWSFTTGSHRAYRPTQYVWAFEGYSHGGYTVNRNRTLRFTGYPPWQYQSQRTHSCLSATSSCFFLPGLGSSGFVWIFGNFQHIHFQGIWISISHIVPI